MDYKHTQIGYLILFVSLALFLYFGFILTLTGIKPAIFIFILIILLILLSFSTLKVVIDEKYLGIKFGYGIYKRRFILREIISARTAKNHWYYGWGIRLWFWPHMWVFNVSGFDAVEIRMRNGRIFRIGTDEPKKLERAILQAIR
ncbi:MAG: hypothetical protein ABH840_01785 [Nanoarchaeota archaeon]